MGTAAQYGLLPNRKDVTAAGTVGAALPRIADILLCTLHASFAKALDYNAADDAKGKNIAAKHFKTADEQKQR